MRPLFLIVVFLLAISYQVKAEWSEPHCEINPIDDKKTCGIEIYSESNDEKLTYYCVKEPNAKLSKTYIALTLEKILRRSTHPSNPRRHSIRMRADKDEPQVVLMDEELSGGKIHLVPSGYLRELSYLWVRSELKVVFEIPYYTGNQFAIFELADQDSNQDSKYGTTPIFIEVEEMCYEN